MPNSEGLVLDADTLGTDKASVRQHYLANNELVGRVNTLGDMRKAMAKQMLADIPFPPFEPPAAGAAGLRPARRQRRI